MNLFNGKNKTELSLLEQKKLERTNIWTVALDCIIESFFPKKEHPLKSELPIMKEEPFSLKDLKVPQRRE